MPKFMRPPCTKDSCRAARRNRFKWSRRADRSLGKIVPWSHWELTRFVDPSALKQSLAKPTGKTYFQHFAGRSIRIRGLAQP